jgi:hypothetical protein
MSGDNDAQGTGLGGTNTSGSNGNAGPTGTTQVSATTPDTDKNLMQALAAAVAGSLNAAIPWRALGLGVIGGGLGDGLQEDELSDLTTAQLELLNSVWKLNSELFDVQEKLVGTFGSGNDAFDNLIKGSQEIYTEFFTTTVDGISGLSAYFDDASEIQRNYVAVMQSSLLQVHSLNKEISAEDMARLALQQQALGFTSQTTQKFIERQFALTGEANDDLLKQTLAYSDSIEKATGYSSKLIGSHIGDMMSNVAMFGNMTVEEMSEAAAAIARVGLEVNDVAKMVGKFNTFEDAALSVSKLTQVFGVQLDTMELMTAANESPEALAAMLQESFEMAGVDMSTMDMPAKRMLASALGGIGVAEVEKLLGPAGQGLSQFASSIEDTTSGVSTDDINNSLNRVESDILRVNRLTETAQDGIEAMGELTRNALVQGFATSMSELQRGILDLGTESARLAGGVADAVPGVIDNFTGGALTSVGELINTVGTSVTGLTDSLRTTNDNLHNFNRSQSSIADIGTALEDFYNIFSEYDSSTSETFANSTDRLVHAYEQGNASIVSFVGDNIDTVSEITALTTALAENTRLSPESIEILKTALITAISTSPVAEIIFEGDMSSIVNAVYQDERFMVIGGDYGTSPRE